MTLTTEMRGVALVVIMVLSLNLIITPLAYAQTVVATVPVGTAPFGVGVNTVTNKIYVSNTGAGTVSVINGATDTVVATVTVGSAPRDVGVNTVTNKIYVSNAGDGTVSVINGVDNSVVATVPVGTAPRGVGVNTVTNKIYVANFGPDTVSVINGVDNSVVATVPVGADPFGVGVNTVTNKIYVANNGAGANTVSVIFDPPIGGGGGSAGGCREKTFTNDPTAYPRCVVIDTTPPKIVRAYVTPSDYLCVEIHDDTQTVKLTYNGKQVPVWLGSGGHFCTNEPLPAVIRVVAEDIAGNKSEMFTINAKQIIITRTEQSLTALLSEELNPHHGIEGIVLKTDSPIKQIRLAKSPDFSDRELYISEKGIMKLDGSQTVVIAYKGQYGKERYGQIYVFATNMGKLATFDVVVNDDIILYPHQEKQRHGTYDLDLRTASVFDEMNLNAFQQAELERVFAGNGELTIIQQNILSMVLRLVDAL